MFSNADFIIKMREYRKLVLFCEKHSKWLRGFKRPRTFFTILDKPIRN